jgi:hypothetical protein
VLENRMLRRIFRLRRDEVTGGWRKLHDEEVHNLCSSSSIVRMIKIKADKKGRAFSANGDEETLICFCCKIQKKIGQ